MEYSAMKRFLSIIALCTMIFASPTLAGEDITVQSGNDTRTVKDTTVHTTLDNGVVISTSTGRQTERRCCYAPKGK